MSTNVDKRVVEMEFDNQQFESRVKTTRKSLQDLKNDLDFDSSVKHIASLERAANGIDLSGITSGVENISNKFSAMGAIGFTVMQNLTNSAINFGKKIANSTIGQIMSGGKQRALNLEQAQFQISGLGVDWKKKNSEGISLYDQIDKAVSGTAYGLDSAAKVAGQVLASGVKEGTKEMQNALSGISGVAAMTNSSYDEIGHIFTTIAGNGKIMGEQFNQFASRGLNVAAALADYLGKTEEEVRDVKNNPIDFKTFAEAMNAKFGEQATKANDTYSGASANVKSALSRIGAEFQAPYLENMRQTFVALIPVINSVKTALLPVFDEMSGVMSFLKDDVVSFLGKFAILDKQGKTVAKDAEKWTTSIKGFIDNLKTKDLSGNSVFDYLKQSYNSVKSIFVGIKNIISDVVSPIQNAFSEMFPSHHIFGNLASGLQQIKNYINNLEKVIFNAANRGNSLKRVASGIFSAFGLLSNIAKIVIKLFGKVVIVFGKVAGLILRLIAPIGDLAQDMYNFFVRTKEASKILKPLSDAFQRLKSSIGTTINEFKKAFSLAFEPFVKSVKGGSKEVSAFAKIASKVLGKFATVLSSVFGKLAVWINNNSKAIKDFGEKLGNAFGQLTSNGLFKSIIDWFNKLKDGISNGISSIGSIKTDGVKTLAEKFKSSASPLEAVGKFFASLFGLIKSLASKIGPIIGSITKLLFDGLSGIASIVKDGIDHLQPTSGSSVLAGGGIVALLVVFMKKISGIFEKVDGLNPKKFLEKIHAVFDGILDYVDTLKKAKAGEALKSFATSILELAVSMLILASIDPERLVSALTAISALIWEMAKVFEVMSGGSNKMKIWEKSDIGSTGAVLLQMASAVLILSLSIKVLEDLDTEQIFKGMIAISALLWELVAVAKVMSSSDKQIAKGASTLVLMAIAVRILVKAVAKLGQLSWDQLAKGLVGTIGLIIGLASAMKLMTKSKGLIKAASGMVIVAVALRIMVPAIKELGSMDWGSLAKAGVAFGGIITMLSLFSRFSKGGSLTANAVGMVIISVSMKIFAKAIKEFTDISWGTLAKAGVTISGLLIAITLFSNFSKGGKLIANAAGMTIMAVALRVFCISIKQFVGMEWSGLAKAGVAIGGLITMLVLFSRLAKPASLIANAVAMTIMGAALLEFVVIMKALSSISWGNIAKSLIAMASAFVIIGVAAKVLGPMTKTIVALSFAMLLFGTGVALVGVGILALSAGIAGLSGSLGVLAKAFQFILVTILESIPMIFKIIGAAIVAFLGIIKDAAPALGAALKAVIIAALDAIIAIAPKLGETIVTLLETFLPIIVQYVPKIVDALISILIGVINALAERIPELVFAVANFIKKLIGAIAEVTGSEITEESIKGIILGLAAVATCMVLIAASAKIAQKALVGIVAIMAVMVMITAMFLALSNINTELFTALSTGISAAMLSISASMFIISKVPVVGAIKGIAGLAIVIAGITAILAALGGLSQIEGFTWLIQEGSKVLAIIGKAIGEFIGNIIGGLLGGIMDSLPKIAEDLSNFMIKLKPFLDGARSINKGMMDGVLALVGVILLLTAAEFINGIASFFGGGANFAKFGEQLCLFAPYMILFGKIVSGVDTESIKKAAGAALALAQFAAAIPNSGGLVSAFAGDNNLADWAPQLVPFGKALVDFSKAVDGKVNAEAVKTAAEAGKAIAAMADKIPNEGGVAGFFAGDNALSTFGPEMASFGKYLAKFSKAVDGKINLEAVQDATKAGTAIAKMADKIPNEGGVAGFFAGDNALSTFGPEMASFGRHLAKFSKAVDGNINVDAVNTAVKAGIAIAKMADKVPNEGGVASWFAGDNALSTFGPEVASFGRYLAKFSKAVEGNIDAKSVYVAVLAASAIAAMANTIPNEGGVVSWFAGDNSLAKFGPELASFGVYLALFCKAVESIKNGDSVKSAVEACSLIVDMTNKIPNEGGVVSWFEGDNSLASFGAQLVSFGIQLALFSKAVDGNINEDAVKKAAKSIDILSVIATSLKGFDSNGIDNFTKGLEALGKAGVSEFIKAFENSGKQATEAANKFLNNMVVGIKSYQSTTVISLKVIAALMVKAVINKIHDFVPDFKIESLNLMKSFSNGISSKKAFIVSEFKEIIVSSVSAVNGYKTDFYNSGKNYMLGIANGIKDNKSKPVNACVEAAKAMIKATRKTLDEHSPSKEGIEVGKFWDLGIAGGVIKYGNAITDAAKDNGNNLINTTMNLLSALSDIDMDDINPTIRPVMDLSDVSDGMNTLSGLLPNSTTYSIGASISEDRAKINEDETPITVETQNDDVVNAIGDLRSDISNLKEYLSKLGIYIDKRTLVGSIIDDVDVSLGKRAALIRKAGE